MDWSNFILFQDVSHNELAELPKYIGLLSRLFRLNISNNKLSSLPPEIGSMDCKDEYFYFIGSWDRAGFSLAGS